MIIRSLAASVLALGLLAPAAFAAENYNCSQDQNNRADYTDCMSMLKSTSNNAFRLFEGNSTRGGPIGDFIDETAQEKNQRSGN